MNSQILPSKKKVIIDKMVTVYGGVELDKDEEDFLLLGPEFALFEPLTRQKAKKDFLITTTKIRWG